MFSEIIQKVVEIIRIIYFRMIILSQQLPELPKPKN